MATTDSNGIIIYQETDPYSPLSTLLNMGMSSVSAAVGRMAGDTGWTTLSVGPGWTVTGINYVQCRRIGPMTYFRGIVQTTTANPTTLVESGVVPEEARPVGQNPVLPVANSTNTGGRITAGTNGSLTYNGIIASGVYVYLNAVQFPVD